MKIIFQRYTKNLNQKLDTIPGTKIPILSDNLLFKNKAEKVSIIINLAWHLSKKLKIIWDQKNIKKQFLTFKFMTNNAYLEPEDGLKNLYNSYQNQKIIKFL